MGIVKIFTVFLIFSAAGTLRVLAQGPENSVSNINSILGSNLKYQSAIALSKVKAGVDISFNNADIGNIYETVRDNQTLIYDMSDDQISALADSMFTSPSLLEKITEALSDWQNSIQNILNQLETEWKNETQIEFGPVRVIKPNSIMGDSWDRVTLFDDLELFLEFMDQSKKATSVTSVTFVKNLMTKLYAESDRVKYVATETRYIGFAENHGQYYYDTSCQRKQNIIDQLFGSTSLMMISMKESWDLWSDISAQLDILFTMT